MGRRSKSFFGGLAINFIGIPINIILGIVCTPIYFKYINNEQFGYWSTILSFFTVLQLTNAGVGVYLIQTVSNYTIEKKIKYAKIKTIFLYQLGVMSASVILIVILKYPLQFYGVISSNTVNHQLYWLMGLFFILNLFFSWFMAYQHGLNRMPYVATFELVQKVLYQSLPLLFLYLGLSISAFPLSYIVFIILGLCIILYSSKDLLLKLKDKVEHYDFKELIRFNLHSFMGGTSYYIINFTDVFIISALLNNSLVTVYLMTFKLNNFLKFIPVRIVSNSFSTLSEIYNEANFERLQEVVNKFYRVCLRVGIFLFFYISLFNQFFVNNWVGEDKYGGFYLSLFSAIICIRFALSSLFNSLVQLSKDIKRLNQLQLFEAVLNISLSIYLASKYSINGIGFASVVSLFPSILYSYWKSCQIIKVNLSFFIPSSFLVVLKSLPSILILISGKVFLDQEFSWVFFLLFSAGAGIGNLIVFEGILIFKNRKLRFKQIIQEVIKQV